MGLDTTHGCWHGAYSAFTRWRNELARVAGYRLVKGELSVEQPDLPWDEFTDENYMGEWNSAPGDDPLLYLQVHSDCGGVIHPAQGVHIAARLEQLLPLLDDQDGIGHIQPHMRGVTERFIAGLREAAAAGEDVEFL